MWCHEYLVNDNHQSLIFGFTTETTEPTLNEDKEWYNRHDDDNMKDLVVELWKCLTWQILYDVYNV